MNTRAHQRFVVDSLSLSNFKLRLENLELMLCFKESLILGSPVSDYARSFDQIAKIYSGSQEKVILLTERWSMGRGSVGAPSTEAETATHPLEKTESSGGGMKDWRNKTWPCAFTAQKANMCWAVSKTAWPAEQGRWFCPSTRLSWAPTCSAVPSSRVLATGKTQTCWSGSTGSHRKAPRAGAPLLWWQTRELEVQPGKEGSRETLEHLPVPKRSL